MSDAPVPHDAAAPHPLAIEAVHWSSGAGSDLVVRVAGRWRRRRTPTTAPPVLTIDTEHQRHRFLARPDPPSVRGAQPGLWQVSFIVPASLAPYLTGRLALIVGSVSISLPPAVSERGEPTGRGGSIVVAERRGRRAEPPEPALPGADVEPASAEAKALLDWLELELARARRESERLRAELEGAERKRREAEQLAHAEAAMRLDLGRDHAVRIQRHQARAGAVLELLQAAQIHARGLAHEVETLRRSADEAGRPRQARRGAPDSGSRARALATELALASSTPPAPPVPAVMATAAETPGLGLELAMERHHAARKAPTPPRRPGHGRPVAAQLEGALLRLAAERAEADELFAREPMTEDEMATDRARAAYVADAIEGIARQLDAVRAVVVLLPPAADERSGHPGAAARGPSLKQPGSVGEPAAIVAPDRLAAALNRLREEYPAPETAPASGSEAPAAVPGLGAEPRVDPPRSLVGELSAALAVAREPAAPAPAPGPAPPSEPAADAPGLAVPRTYVARWLLRALSDLRREEPALVGSIVLALLPAQGLVLAGPVRYDIVLSDGGGRSVTATDEEIHVEVIDRPRPLDDVDFRIEGDLAGLARLLLYGRLRRRLSRRVARLRGDRRALAALEWLVREPVGLHDLYASGVRLDPELALLLVAHMIDPSWTAGECFMIGHQSPERGPCVYLLVRDGARPRVSRQPPLDPVATTIRCSDEQLLALLAGAGRDGVEVRGASAPVASLCAWIARAQRDS